MAEVAITELSVAHLQQTLALLEMFAPDLKRRLEREIRDVMSEVGAKAQGRFDVHPSNLGLELAAAGIIVKKIPARFDNEVGYSVHSITKPGAIGEFAAVGKTAQGAALVTVLEGEYGSPGRFVWEAWDQERDAAYQRVSEALAEVEAEYDARLAVV